MWGLSGCVVHPWDPCRLLTPCSALAWSHVGGAFLPTRHQGLGLSSSGVHRETLFSCLWVLSLPTGKTGVLWPCISSLVNWLPLHFCQVRLGSRHIFSPGPVHSLLGIGREIFKTYILSFLFFFSHSTPHLVLNTYMSCCEYVCEWISQDSKFELQENSFVLQCTWLNVRKGTDKDLAILRVSLEWHLTL